MAQNFWTAIDAWTVCFVVTIAVSLMTRPRPDRELAGLVYSLTERPSDRHLAWYRRPAFLGGLVIAGSVLLNVLFF
jgi:SSS family solute:Na+ symporter